MAKNKSQYDSTLNLPKTLFEMRAGLPKKEPAMLEDWEKNDLYNNLIKHNDGKPKFVLHDGPPYANGNIHMGTALNKIIKDIIIRDKNMEGFQAPYVPGFDTHGLPIELKALSSVGEKKKDISKLELRQICEKFATEHVKEAKNLLKLAAELRGCYKDQQAEIPEELLAQKSTVIYTTSRKDLGVPEIDRKELEEFIDAIPEIPVIVRDNIKEDARIKAFDLKKRMLYDIKEFGEDNEGE